MLTFVFLFFIAAFAIGGIVISMSAKKNKINQASPQAHLNDNASAIGRANTDED